MAKDNFKVEIPKNPDDMLELIKDVLEKHVADGANSIITKSDADALQSIYDVQSAKRAKWKDVERAQKDETEKINLALGLKKGQTVNTPGTAKFYITKVRDIILANNKGNPNYLGKWGFTVKHHTGGSTPPSKNPPSTSV